jgi:hypothetical protein
MRRAALLAAIALAISSSGCHKAAAAATPTITITPTDLDLEAGSSEQFGDTVTNETSTAVTWLINGLASATAQQEGFGSITTNGLYQAPTTPPTGEAVVITVELTSDTSLTAEATVVITPIPVVSISPATLSPVAPALPAAPTEFTASLFGVPNCESPAVTWQVGDIAGGNATVGTIVQTSAPVEMCVQNGGPYTATSTANYFPPQVPPPGGSVFVSVYLDADTTQSAGATVTLQYAAPSLQGSYAFYLAGQNSSSAFFGRAGQLIANGTGTFSGMEDVHIAGSAATTSSISGTYTVGVDGRGTATLTDSAGTTNYYLTVVNANEIKLTEADNSATAHGEADLQTASALNQASFSGGYAFDFYGVSGSSPVPTSEIGQFSATGAGGALQNGLEDTDAGGTVTSGPAGATFSGNFGTISATTGRGTATISGSATTYTFYVISPTQVDFIETDGAATLVGAALQQSGGTPNAGFLSLGENIFAIAGRSSTGRIAAAGSFLADGIGGTPTSISNGLYDQNNDGTVTTSVAYTGTYSVAASGRGTASFTVGGQTTKTFVMYFISTGYAYLQETDNSIVGDGVLLAQRGGSSFGTANVTGSFALSWTGAKPPMVAQQDATGQLTVGKTNGVVAGTWDRNDALVLQPGIVLTGTYSLATTGRGIVTLMDPSNNEYDLAAYVADSNTVFLVDTDTTLVFEGQLTRQF